MKPRLLVLSGASDPEFIEIPIDDRPFTIGRSVECDLPIGSAAVSRRHCEVVRSDEGYEIVDLDSHNGTFVNDLPVKLRRLADGDRITIGNTNLIFLTSENEAEEAGRARFDDSSLKADSSILLSPHLDTAEFTPDLNTLARIGAALNEITDSQTLQHRFVEIILEFVPAQRGAIIVTDDDLSELRSVCVWRNPPAEPSTMQISRTVCRQVLSGFVGLLSNDLSDSYLDSAESLIASRTSSVLCVPLRIGDQPGVLYLDSDDPLTKFTAFHLQQMTALSFLISAALANARSFDDLRQENEILRAGSEIETSMVGESGSIRSIYDLIAKVAPTDSTVLINGESGTGKELVARAIHLNSTRRGRTFTAINCAVLSETLLESELFGYERGAFTGATGQRKGKLELTNGGTLFLDEIGELAPSIQAKLLRVLQEKEFERVGGTVPIKADVRLIAATNRKLADEIVKGNFRQDLYFRLNVVKIDMPPLRDRRSDILILAQHFIRKYNEKCSRKVMGLTEAARRVLVGHDWPGNIRELENVIERAIVLGAKDVIDVDDLPDELVGTEPQLEGVQAGFREQLIEAKRRIVSGALARTGNNYTEAAASLGIHPNNLHRLVRTLGMKDPESN